MIGMFGLLDTYLFYVFIFLYCIGLVLVSIADVSLERISFKWYYRILIAIAIMASFFGIFLAMYIGWTPNIYGIGAQIIEGVQGRYFLPLLFPFVLIFSNKWISDYKCLRMISEKILEYSDLLSISILIISLVTIGLRFWV